MTRRTALLALLCPFLFACSSGSSEDGGGNTTGATGTSSAGSSTASSTAGSSGGTSGSTSAGTSGGATSTTTSSSTGSSGGSTGGMLVDGGFSCGGDVDGGSDSWRNYAQCFFSTYCVGCHNPSGQASAQNFSEYGQVSQYANHIRCGVSTAQDPSFGACSEVPKQFPIGSGPFPSDSDRDRIVGWIDAGLPF